MNNISFNQELAITLYESSDEFPANFEDAWQWLGYSKKQNAKDKLTRNFEKSIDYIVTQMRVNPTQQGIQAGRPLEQIRLTIDCFKSLGMMAGTEQGRIIRKYFLECERIAKQKVVQTAVEKHFLKPEIPQIGLSVDTVFASTGIDPKLIAGVKANQIASIYPELALAMEESKKILGISIEEGLVRPGKLAELYESKTGVKLSAQKMNTLLADKGLQVKNAAGANPLWLPTDEGKQYSQLVLDTAKGHNKTVQSLQWYPSVIEVI